VKNQTTKDRLLLPGDDVSPSRRSFLQWAGFGLSAASLASCSRRAETLALPWTQAPEDVVAGRAWWIATTCAACPAACGVLARCRDGRPVKLEGNELNPTGAGGLCAVGQASLLELYDSHRLAGPRTSGKASSWRDLDLEVRRELDQIRARGRVRLLTGTLHSPSTLATIGRFLAAFADAKHVMYDALSVSAVLDAHERTHGVRLIPDIRFDRARAIASFDADFLGTWIAPVSYTTRYASRRGPGEDRSHHVQIESRLSLTGSRADRRVLLSPRETRRAIERLCAELAGRAGESVPEVAGLEAALTQTIVELADRLWMARGQSLVVSGSNDVDCQALVNEANERLGNYGHTLDLQRASLQRRGDDRAVAELAGELERGEVDLLVVAGCNPAYDWPVSTASALQKAKVLVACSAMVDETAALARWVAPEPHYLETWDDSEPVLGRFGLSQPTVPPLRDSRSLRRSLSAWMGEAKGDRELVAEHWKSAIWPRFPEAGDFEGFFRKSLHDGAVELPLEALAPSQARFAGRGELSRSPDAHGPLTLVLYPKVSLLDGAHAHNPWLQELPDPITKVTWGNYACVSPALARQRGFEDGDLVRLSVEGQAQGIELPVCVQRGQHDGVVAVALGYGRAGTDRFATVGPEWIGAEPTVRPGEHVGVNAAPLLALVEGHVRGDVRSVSLARVAGRRELARTQDYDSLELPAALAPHGYEKREHVRTVPAVAPSEVERPSGGPENSGLWADDHETQGHRWGMVIDLARCTGCSACVVGCTAENNVPVVGRDEVLRHREMHWLRIDRYMSGDGESVRVEHQPMLCQHCANAPCESVCPVLATVHSSEGLNQQVYNRCVGTRYCANTCPYKVRRFNWFDYPRGDRLQNHSLNPDVTVRSRGVMEKCSFCVQRIQDAKLEARRSGRPLADRAVRTACEQSCPAQAIRFGDLADPTTLAAQGAADARAYALLAELNVRPSIRYLAAIDERAGKGGSHGR